MYKHVSHNLTVTKCMEHTRGLISDDWRWTQPCRGSMLMATECSRYGLNHMPCAPDETSDTILNANPCHPALNANPCHPLQFSEFVDMVALSDNFRFQMPLSVRLEMRALQQREQLLAVRNDVMEAGSFLAP